MIGIWINQKLLRWHGNFQTTFTHGFNMLGPLVKQSYLIICSNQVCGKTTAISASSHHSYFFFHIFTPQNLLLATFYIIGCQYIIYQPLSLCKIIFRLHARLSSKWRSSIESFVLFLSPSKL